MASTLLLNIKIHQKNFLNDEMDQIFATTKLYQFPLKMHLILSTINAPIFFLNNKWSKILSTKIVPNFMKRNQFPQQQQQNEFPPKSLKNDNCTKISSTTTSKWTNILSTTHAPKFPQRQHQNGLNSLSTTNAPKFPQQQHQHGQNSLNNRCTQISSTTTSKWTQFSQQQMHQNFLNNNIKMD
jgi:hypothetical protein